MSCRIEGCIKPPCNSRGWCQAHYLRWWRHGDPLAGSTSMGEAQAYFRDVVLAYEGDECLIWPFAKSKEGYGRVWVDGKLQVVSRLVCQDVNGLPPTPEHEAAHSCGKGSSGCVTKNHLSWKTHADNQADRIVHGTALRGVTKLTEDQVLQIRALKGSIGQQEIAAQFGISRSQVSGIQCGRRWAWLEATP